MLSSRRPLAALALPLALAACGDDGGPGTPGGDAAPDPGADASALCAEFAAPAETVSSYPASVSGDLSGAGAELSVAETVCLDERRYYEQIGEDQVVHLSGLTPGAEYVLRLRAGADLSFYVATGCDPAAAGPVSGQCLLFVDQALGREYGEFVASDAGEAFVVIDHFGDQALEDGSYTLDVYEPACAGASGCSGDSPVCHERACVACASPVHCTDLAAPVCDPGDNTCGPGFDECTGDDEVESGDDGPAGAIELSPTELSPAEHQGRICSQPAAELDYYRITLDEAGARALTLSWESTDDAPADLDLFLLDGTGQLIAESVTSSPELIRRELDPGAYYLAVSRFQPGGEAETTPYTVTARIPECSTSFDCELAAPLCDAGGSCIAGPDQCTGDDGSAEAAGDDGPAGARDVTPALGATSTTTSQICNTPAAEADWFRVEVEGGDGLAIDLSWADPVGDLDVTAYDAEGRRYGLSFWRRPELVTLTNLPAGPVYIEVVYYGAPVVDAIDYALSVTRTAGGCASAADCAAEHSTQIYRGACDAEAGACRFLDGAGQLAAGAHCDSADDCESGLCSARIFESDAELSVCTVACNRDAECTDALGSGYACTDIQGAQQDTCHPACELSTECGANPGSSSLDGALPWDYLRCTAEGACSS